MRLRINGLYTVPSYDNMLCRYLGRHQGYQWVRALEARTLKLDAKRTQSIKPFDHIAIIDANNRLIPFNVSRK